MPMKNYSSSMKRTNHNHIVSLFCAKIEAKNFYLFVVPNRCSGAKLATALATYQNRNDVLQNPNDPYFHYDYQV